LRVLLTNGWVDGASLTVAGYDWRFAPDKLGDFFSGLATTVERAYAANGNRRVYLLGHSAGPSVLLFFLSRRPQAWKDRYVAALVAMNGNFAGEIDCLENLWHGGDFLSPALGVQTWDRQAYWRAQWSWGVTSWCLPQIGFYGNRTLVRVREEGRGRPQLYRNYTAADMPSLFRLFGMNNTGGAAIWPAVAGLTAASRAPGVRAYCLYGTGVATPVRYDFSDPGNLSRPTHVEIGSGDGQQDDSTNSACLLWHSAQFPAVAKGFAQADHDSLLSDPRALEFLLAEVLV
jgi:pimeloyl-ACP methyl ester carboxylesterase